jgi:hypothetical protein
MPEALDRLAQRAEALLTRLEELLPAPPQPPDMAAHIAFRWRRHAAAWGGRGALEPVASPHRITYADLLDIDEQRDRLDRNTRQFVAGRPANNVLLTGSRGTGKSSLVKAALHAYANKGLRMIEVDRCDLVALPEIVQHIAHRRERFIVFSDDLSFEADDPGFKALKSVLDGSLSGGMDNLLIYATSNRRHLMPEFMHENLAYQHTAGGEIHPGETTEEKISLSERFGLWLSFYPFDQQQYLNIARHWVGVLNPAAAQDPGLEAAAKLWALERASRSGRVAYQFARDFAGSASARRGRRARP